MFQITTNRGRKVNVQSIHFPQPGNYQVVDATPRNLDTFLTMYPNDEYCALLNERNGLYPVKAGLVRRPDHITGKEVFVPEHALYATLKEIVIKANEEPAETTEA